MLLYKLVEEENSFLKMDNPLWYIIALMIGSALTLISTWLTKNSELKNDAKKIFLGRRIERHENLYNILAEAQYISWLPGDKTYFKIFSSPENLNIWLNKYLEYANSNSLYFSKEVLIDVTFISNVFKQINTQIRVEKYTSEELQLFCNKYYSEIQDILFNSSTTIMRFFEKDISLNYKLNSPTDKDYIKSLRKLNSLKLIKDNNLEQTHVI